MRSGKDRRKRRAIRIFNKYEPVFKRCGIKLDKKYIGKLKIKKL